MGVKTSIEWTRDDDGRPGASVSPIRARNKETGRPGWFCSHVSDGCIHCYSEAMNHRLGTGIDYRTQNLDLVDVYLDEKILMQPLRWKRPRRIFWNSMSDTFGGFVAPGWIDRMFAVMALTPQHTHLVLTKRAERMRDSIIRIGRSIDTLEIQARKIGYTLEFEGIGLVRWPLPNVWSGVSCEDQRRADERIPVLLDTLAAVRWVSAEPLLGPVDLTVIKRDFGMWDDALRGIHKQIAEYPGRSKLDWVVVGGESGPRARPFDVEWARSIIAQCRAAGVACFVKQLGANPIEAHEVSLRKISQSVKDRKGGNPEEWPADLRVREYPA
jgi:protein gp37